VKKKKDAGDTLILEPSEVQAQDQEEIKQQLPAVSERHEEPEKKQDVPLEQRIEEEQSPELSQRFFIDLEQIPGFKETQFYANEIWKLIISFWNEMWVWIHYYAVASLDYLIKFLRYVNDDKYTKGLYC
jgi:hypothetical protein